MLSLCSVQVHKVPFGLKSDTKQPIPGPLLSSLLAFHYTDGYFCEV